MIKIGRIGIGHNHGVGKMGSVRKFPHIFEVVGYTPRARNDRKAEDVAYLRGGFLI